MPAMTQTRRSKSTVAAAVAVGAGLLALAGSAGAQSQPPPPTLTPGVIADGVRIAGVDVGGLGRADAVRLVLRERVAAKRKRLVVSFRGKRFAVNPVALGYRADVRYSVTAALNFGRSRPVPASGVNVPLRERVSNKRVRALIRARARKLDVPARNASIRFRGSKPVITKARKGIAMRQRAAETRLRRAILGNRPRVVKLPSARVRPSVTNAPPAILINRSAFKLTLYKGGRTRSFRIAVGQPGHPTPAGSFSIVDKQRNPTWFPPDSPWAAGLGPVPPGSGNPLGTRWMGTSYPAIGIHGTPVPSSLGTRASHGCIRMAIPSAEWLFDQITVGTPVVIV
jgi:lipoprotein-anchoring transpeptidase ErfK/SrfK